MVRSDLGKAQPKRRGTKSAHRTAIAEVKIRRDWTVQFGRQAMGVHSKTSSHGHGNGNPPER
jgi:hypothetical protein